MDVLWRQHGFSLASAFFILAISAMIVITHLQRGFIRMFLFVHDMRLLLCTELLTGGEIAGYLHSGYVSLPRPSGKLCREESAVIARRKSGNLLEGLRGQETLVDLGSQAQRHAGDQISTVEVEEAATISGGGALMGKIGRD